MLANKEIRQMHQTQLQVELLQALEAKQLIQQAQVDQMIQEMEVQMTEQEKVVARCKPIRVVEVIPETGEVALGHKEQALEPDSKERVREPEATALEQQKPELHLAMVLDQEID